MYRMGSSDCGCRCDDLVIVRDAFLNPNTFGLYMRALEYRPGSIAAAESATVQKQSHHVAL